MELVALSLIGNLTHYIGFTVVFCLHALSMASSWRVIIWQGHHGASSSHFPFCYLSWVPLQGRSVERGPVAKYSCESAVQAERGSNAPGPPDTPGAPMIPDPIIICLLPSYFFAALQAAQPLFKSFWRPSSKLVRIKTRRKYAVAPKRSLWPALLHGPSYTNVTWKLKQSVCNFNTYTSPVQFGASADLLKCKYNFMTVC